jgi:IS605 OrfB family transposase
MEHLIKTVELKIEDVSVYSILDNLGNYYSHIERVLYNYLYDKDITNGVLNSLKSQYIVKYGISARLFGAMYIVVKGKMDGAKKLHKQSLKDAEVRIKGLKEKIKKCENRLKTSKKLTKKDKDRLWLSVSQWKQKIDRLNQYINFQKPTKMLFGTKALYKKQWTVEKYSKNREVWLKEWRRKRDFHFCFVGSKDETSGNSLCQYHRENDREFLQIRLPNAMIEQCGKYVNFEVATSKPYYSDFHTAVLAGTALTYKFLKKENDAWYAHISFTLEKELQKTITGCSGIDINYGLIANTTVDRNGNFVGIQNYPCDPEFLTSEQMEDLISTQLSEIVNNAKINGYRISAENLDLSKKKLFKYDKITNRKIHMIAYGKIWNLLISKCFKAGVPLIGVNPAYTSFIGHFKYEKMYGLSRHNAAAMCIARRGLGLKDKLPAFIASVLQSGEESKRKTKKASLRTSWSQVYRHRHHWAHWAYLKKNLERCSSVLADAEDPGGSKATFEDTLTSRFNPSYLSFVGRS